MKILVKQNKITIFGRQYNVYQNKKKLFTIRRLWPTLIPKYVITENPSGKRIGGIQNKFLSLTANAMISLPSGEYKFNQEGMNSMNYTCSNSTKEGSDIFNLSGNKGFSGSIYKNKEQIGKWNKNQFVFLDGDSYEIDLDVDSDILLIASMMILVDTYRISVIIGGDMGWEIGNIGKGLKKIKN